MTRGITNTQPFTDTEKDLIVERLLGAWRPSPHFHLWDWRSTGGKVLRVRYVLVGEIEALSWKDAALMTGVREARKPQVVGMPARRAVTPEGAVVRAAAGGS